jgi:hypothetical protein
MRFHDVLTFCKKTGEVTFNITHLFQMRDVKTEDVEHLGKITRCTLLKKNGFLSSFLFKKDNTLSFWTDSDLYVGKYKMNDFRIGCATMAPFAIILSSAFLGFPWKTCIVIGGVLYFV